MTVVFRTVGNLKNNEAVGIDGVSADMLKTSLLVKVFFQFDVHNVPLSSGWFSKYPKDAKVYFFFSLVDIMTINNYRSFSMLPVSSKIFEKVMYERFYFFLETNKTFCSKQFGSRNKRSTADSLAEFTEQSRQEKINTFTCMLLDLRKAFDSCNPKIFMAKLEKHVVGRICSNWFESYLLEGRQCVQVIDVLFHFL